MAVGWRNKTAILFTGSDEPAARAMAAGLVPAPNLTLATLLSAQAYIQALGSITPSVGQARPGQARLG
jgi:hypothetical protein